MQILLAGASGAIGHRLVPQLVEQGHHVVATTRTPAKADDLAALGAEPAVVDVLDRNAVIDAVGAAKPDVLIHQATALAGSFDLKHFERYFAQTNRLRTIGRSGSRGESHPPAPTDPYVTVSRHTALVVLIIWRPVSPKPSVRSTAAVTPPRRSSTGSLCSRC